MTQTDADAVMVGRAAQGRVCIFHEIAHYLATGAHLPPPQTQEVRDLLLEHLLEHYDLYGEYAGVRSARKHIGWYVNDLPGGSAFRQHMNTLESAATQHAAVAAYFSQLAQQYASLPAAL